MFHQRLINSVSLLCITLQSVSPVLASFPVSLDDVQSNWENAGQSEMRSSLGFPAEMERTAAGVVHYANLDGVPHVLLGRRVDEACNSQHGETGSWCNLGGGTDAQDSVEGESHVSLARTASREVAEESNGIYAHHPLLLRQRPYVDTFNGELLYRTYFQRVQHIPAETFLEKQAEAVAHGREYTSFLWVKVADLLSALKKGTAMVYPNADEPVHLYPPLLQTLLTPAAMAFLEHIAERGEISPFKRDIRQISGRIYFTNQKQDRESVKSDGALPDASQSSVDSSVQPSPRPVLAMDPQEIAEAASRRERMNLLRTPLVVRPVQRQEESTEEFNRRHEAYLAARTHFALVQKERFADEVFEPGIYETLPISSRKEVMDLSLAVASRVNMLLELKAHPKFANVDMPSDADVSTRSTAAGAYNPNASDSTSHISLRIILGPDYKLPQNFPEASDPQDAADEANLQLFLDRYYRKSRSTEFGLLDARREVEVLQSDLDNLKGILKWERTHKEWPTFYHATTEALGNFSKIFRLLHQFVLGRPLASSGGLRGTDLYFHNIKTMQDALDRFGYEDYGGRQNLVLSANMTLLAGLQTTQTTSSSVEYMLNNHAVNPPSGLNVLQETLALCGFSTATDQYFQSLFQQYTSDTKGAHGNGVMFAVQIHPDQLDRYVYAAYGGGKRYELAKGGQVTSLHQLYAGLYEEWRRQLISPTSFDTDRDRKAALIPEVRILLHPELVQDPQKARIKSFSRFPMEDTKDKAFWQELSQVMGVTVAEWLAEEGEVLEGSFATFPLPKKMYRQVYKGLTGHDPVEKPAKEGFKHLVRLGQGNQAKALWQSYQGKMKVTSEDYDDLVRSAVLSNSKEAMEFVTEEVLKKTLNLELSFNEISKLSHICWNLYLPNTLGFLGGLIEKTGVLELKTNHKTLGANPYNSFLFKMLARKGTYLQPLDPHVHIPHLMATYAMMKGYSRDELMSMPHARKANQLLHSLLLALVVPDYSSLICAESENPPNKELAAILHSYVCNIPGFQLVDFWADLIEQASATKNVTVFPTVAQRRLGHLLKTHDPQGEWLKSINPGTQSPYIFDLLGFSSPLEGSLMNYLAAQDWLLHVRDLHGRSLLQAAQDGFLNGGYGYTLQALLCLGAMRNADFTAELHPLFRGGLVIKFLEADSSIVDSLKHPARPKIEFTFEENRNWMEILALAETEEQLTKAYELCPDPDLLQVFEGFFHVVRLSPYASAIQERKKDSLKAWGSKMVVTLKTKPSDSRKKTSLFGADMGGGDGLAQLLKSLLKVDMQADNPFALLSSAAQHSLAELIQQMPDFVSNPEQIQDALGMYTGSLMATAEWKETLLPLLEKRQPEELKQLEGWKSSLVIAVDHQAHAGVKKLLEDMPYLDRENMKWALSTLAMMTHQVAEIKRTYPAPQLRRLFLDCVHKENSSRLDEILPTVFHNQQDFERLFTFPPQGAGTLSFQAFSFWLDILNLDDPLAVLKALNPYTTKAVMQSWAQNTPDEVFESFLKKPMVRAQLNEIIDLMPEFFVYHGQGKDIFERSLMVLPPKILRTLIALKPGCLSEMQEGYSFMPYVALLLSKDSHAFVVHDALHQDPSLLSFATLDGLSLYEYARFVASPGVWRVIQEFKNSHGK
ncbi:MAG: hypothetical protein ACK5O7_05050 [Holosporales bacterium]